MSPNLRRKRDLYKVTRPLMETCHPGPRASIGQHVSTTPPRTPTSQSCRFTVGSQCEGASCTVEPSGSSPAGTPVRMPCSSPPLRKPTPASSGGSGH